VRKAAGSPVLAGSVNRESRLVVRVTASTADSRVSQIVRLVERAMGERPSIARLADRIASWSVAGVLIAALGALVAWWFVDRDRAVAVAVAVLVVSCPCALSLAVPTVVAAATSALARRGILVTRGDAIEALASVDDVVFDKTGTLTEGSFALVAAIPLRGQGAEACVELAAALEAGSVHPIASAFRAAAAGRTLPATAGVRDATGCGIEGVIDGRRYRLGTPAWTASLHGDSPPDVAEIAAAEGTPIALCDEQGWVAWFTLSDRARAGASSVVTVLRGAGFDVHVLSGDQPRTVAHVARQLGIDSAVGGVDPEGKLGWLQALQRRGRRVLMVGDGVNDAPVLAGANVSMAMATGTPLAMVSADVVLLRADLNGVPAALAASRKAIAVMRENFAWAALYNAVAIPLAAAGALTPLIAGAGMAASSLLVVLNAMRLAGAPDSQEPAPAIRRRRHSPSTAGESPHARSRSLPPPGAPASLGAARREAGMSQ
jgi:Cu2+-exporting ATPase